MKRVFNLIICLFYLHITNAQNLIRNGSFEQPSVSFQQSVTSGSTFLTDWTIGGSGDVYIHNGPANGGNYGPAQDGVDYLDLSGSSGTHAFVYQDFQTIPGRNYTLSLYTGSSSFSPTSTIHLFVFENEVGYLLKTDLTPLAPTGNVNWKQEIFSFTASQPSTRLEFQDTSSFDDNASYIDNVSITQAPEPTTMGMALVSLTTVFLLRKRRI